MIHTVINVVDIVLTIGMIFMLVYQVSAAMRIEATYNPHLTRGQILHQFFYIYAQGGRRGFIRSFSHLFGILIYLVGFAVIYGLFAIGFRGVTSVILFQTIFPVLLSCFIQPPYWWTDYDRHTFDQL